METLRRPNVIFVITDDQGYGDIAYHGNGVLHTPHLDQMARESVQLNNHHHDPLCSPSRAALMTGQYASRSGVWHVIHGRHLLSPDAMTMADVFADNEYRTGMFGKWHLGDNYPFAPQYRGFEDVVYHKGGGVGELPDYWGNDYIDDIYFYNGQPVQYAGYCTDVFFDEAINFVEHHQNEPFFVYLATNAMHSPFIVPDQYSKPYREQGVPEERANFYGMIQNFDENMGKLFTRLDDLNLDDNTIVIFTADHGTAAGYDPVTGDGYNAGLRDKKGSVYDGGHQVNFFIRWKNNLPQETPIKELTAHVDVLPTLIDLCELELKSDCGFDGISLVPHIKQTDVLLPERSVVIHLQPDKPIKWHHCVVMTNRWRLVNGKELYDIQQDQAQQHDIAHHHPDVIDALRQEYDHWWDSLSSNFDQFTYISVGTIHENPTLLSARDWHPTQGRIPWMQDWISDPAYDANGFWMIDVVEDGSYEAILRRFPKEANLPIGANSARLSLGNEYEQIISTDDTAVSFVVDLKQGKTSIQTWLQNTHENREFGSYYTSIRKL